MELEKLEKKIKKEFKAAEKEVVKKANEYFKQFELEDRKMRKKYSDKEISKKDYINWRKDKMAQGLEFRKLEIVLAENVKQSQEIATKLINNNLKYTYADAFNYSTYEIEKLGRVNTSFSLVDEATVSNLVKDNPDLLPKAKLPKGVLKWDVNKVNSALLQGILAGDDIEKIASRLSQVTNQAGGASIRTARTLTTASENVGRLNSYERAMDMGIVTKKVWMATNDSRTRHSHAELDGEEVEINETFSNDLKFPGDPDGDPGEVYNCRCTMKSHIVKIDYSDDVYRDTVVAQMGYDRWKRSRRNA